MAKDLADKIADVILADVTDRRGWRQEWDNFDREVQSDIKRAWREKIRTVLRREA